MSGDVCSLVVRAADALEDGDVEFTRELLALAVETIERKQPTQFRCGLCGRGFRWPGELDHHLHVETSHGLGAAP
jgi:hypothetical protein